ncbi:MAG: Nmad5 family putative nucleotide modification protein [Pseudomonadota bacterium]
MKLMNLLGDSVTRLTNHYRRIIISRVLEAAGFNDENKEAHKLETQRLLNEAREKIMQHCLGRSLVQRLRNIPAEHRVKAYDVPVMVDGKHYRVPWVAYEKDEALMELFAGVPDWKGAQELSSRSAAARAVLKWDKHRNDWDNRLNSLKNEIGAIVWSVTTVKKLLELWPEGAPYVNQVHASEGKSLVPAEAINKVNKALKAA